LPSEWSREAVVARDHGRCAARARASRGRPGARARGTRFHVHVAAGD